MTLISKVTQGLIKVNKEFRMITKKDEKKEPSKNTIKNMPEKNLKKNSDEKKPLDSKKSENAKDSCGCC